MKMDEDSIINAIQKRKPRGHLHRGNPHEVTKIGPIEISTFDCNGMRCVMKFHDWVFKGVETTTKLLGINKCG